MALRKKHASLGAKKLAKLLSRGEIRINHKKVARILKENGLGIVKKKRTRKDLVCERIPVPANVDQVGDVWSIDFMCMRNENAFRFMLFNVINVRSRVCPVMKVERTFTSYDVTDELEKAMERVGKPTGIITDNGTEFTSAHFRIWCRRNEIVHHLTNKGRPAENCYVESFNSSVRREVLDLNDFRTMNELRHKVEIWRKYYNSERPHGSLSYQSPENYNNLTKTLEVAV